MKRSRTTERNDSRLPDTSAHLRPSETLPLRDRPSSSSPPLAPRRPSVPRVARRGVRQKVDKLKKECVGRCSSGIAGGLGVGEEDEKKAKERERKGERRR
ncbi:hypothetical protein EYF80_052112 [Liparis tanakae]|uniref:Uncharacterized protein n=1 Tax=Liparis tanakae TaxID=230148 RepID=A0A4Z2FBG6_9TELE|nr:hypothetical protein EYF80_052112 [Liparis tanakae]